MYKYQALIQTKAGGQPVIDIVYANNVSQAKAIIAMSNYFKSFVKLPVSVK